MSYSLYPTTSAGDLQEPFLAEDVMDTISNLFHLDLTLFRFLERVPMSQVMIEAPVDSYGGGVAITRTAATGYGTSTPVRTSGHTPTVGAPFFGSRVRSVAELHVEADGVDGTTRAVELYGITDRYTLQMLKLARKVANDFEHSVWWAQGTAPNGAVIDAYDGTSGASGITGVNNSFPRQTQGLVPMVARTGLTRTLTPGASSCFSPHGEELSSTYFSYCYNAGNVMLDRGMFNGDLMTPWWTLGGQPDRCVIFCSPKVKALFTTFALQAAGAINDRKIDAYDKRVIDTVDAYETDNGLHFINRSLYLNIPEVVNLKYAGSGSQLTLATAMDEVLIAVMPSYFKIGVLRPIGVTPLGKTGDRDVGMVTGELALVNMNPLGAAGILNCVS